MINTFNIGKLVYNLLASLVSDRVYPIVAENGTNFPYIIYMRDTIIPTICKDGIYEDQANVTVRIVTSTYFSGINLALQVRQNLTLHNYNFDNMNICSEMTSADETYDNDSYVQSLVFEFKINNI